ncbi:MAG: CoA ester lyase [Myxococcales bacterium]|nr:CoA ester lyase [Myxococcales bacterium]MDH3482793.1 CoA ester lyase [Myxococcales bacterium]
MTATHRPRRSVLYMPGSNARALDKSRTLPADALIFDLEDAVAPEAKVTARTQVIQTVEAGGYGKREILIRTNGLNTPWGYDDLAAVAAIGADAILLPKVESAEMVRQAESVLIAHGAAPELAIWCMMENPRAMLHAEEIADASPRVGGLVMGTSDLAKDLQAQHTAMRLPLITSLGLCMLAARAARIAILDGVYLDLNDHEGFVDSCRQGAELGFDGKTLIHPKQLAAANEVFAPSDEEVRLSQEIIEAYAEAEAQGRGVVVVDGKLIEKLHVDHAKRVVALANAIRPLA